MPATHTQADAVPDYDPLLVAFHRAFRPELRRAVAGLELPPAGRVLDVPCGDGFYTKLLARRLGPRGRVVAADLLPAYLRRAKRTIARTGLQRRVKLVPADIYDLPFPANHFDAVWCAQSFISLGDPVAALRELRRVVRAGGTVAVLEDDEFHHVLLPWPDEVELIVAAARRPGKRNVGRRLPRWLRQAGLVEVGKRTIAADRTQPFRPAVRRFLDLHLAKLWERVRDHLPAAARRAVEWLTDPDSPTYLPAHPDAELTCVFTVWAATKVTAGRP
jgi:ubiquinone/menaquinone biosynthesis C-methylase UbiE